MEFAPEWPRRRATIYRRNCGRRSVRMSGPLAKPLAYPKALAGLVENKLLSEILDMFRDETKRRSIFAPARSPWRPLYKLVRLLWQPRGHREASPLLRAGWLPG